MKILYQFILFSVLVASAVASLALGRYNSTEHPGKCAVLGLVLSPGDEAQNPTTDCGILVCGKDGWVTFADCPIMGIADERYELGDRKYPDKDYPECCEREIVRIESNLN